MERLSKIHPDSASLYVSAQLKNSFGPSPDDSLVYYTLLRNHAVFTYNKGGIDSSLVLLDKIIRFREKYKQLDNEYELAFALRNYAQITQIRGEKIEKSLGYHNRAIKIAERNNYPEILIPTLHSKALLLSNNARHGEAIESIEKAIKVSTETRTFVTWWNRIRIFS